MLMGISSGVKRDDGEGKNKMGGVMGVESRKVLRALFAAAILAACGAMSINEAMAERSIQIGQAKRTATVTVYIGKTEDVRTDTSFVELQVGDPEVADVN